MKLENKSNRGVSKCRELPILQSKGIGAIDVQFAFIRSIQCTKNL